MATHLDEDAVEAEDAASRLRAVGTREDRRFLNRELSWLDFNARVLALAEDETVPLLERAKFLAIFAENLDEFFQVRVAGLRDQLAAGLSVTRGELEPLLRKTRIDPTSLVTRAIRRPVCCASKNAIGSRISFRCKAPRSATTTSWLIRPMIAAILQASPIRARWQAIAASSPSRMARAPAAAAALVPSRSGSRRSSTQPWRSGMGRSKSDCANRPSRQKTSDQR